MRSSRPNLRVLLAYRNLLRDSWPRPAADLYSHCAWLVRKSAKTQWFTTLFT